MVFRGTDCGYQRLHAPVEVDMVHPGKTPQTLIWIEMSTHKQNPSDRLVTFQFQDILPNNTSIFSSISPKPITEQQYFCDPSRIRKYVQPKVSAEKYSCSRIFPRQQNDWKKDECSCRESVCNWLGKTWSLLSGVSVLVLSCLWTVNKSGVRWVQVNNVLYQISSKYPAYHTKYKQVFTRFLLNKALGGAEMEKQNWIRSNARIERLKKNCASHGNEFICPWSRNFSRKKDLKQRLFMTE